MVHLSRTQRSGMIALFLGLFLFVIIGSVYAQGGESNLEVAVLPATLERISWGAILAGTIIAIVLQLAGNLLAIGVGINQINPNPEHGEDVPTPQTIGTATIGMMVVSILLALFIGGYIAARFAGSPDQGDALLHGLMVWGLNIIVTLFLLSTTLGTVFSGLSALLGQGLRMIGSVTSTVAHGAATVAGSGISMAGEAASGVASNVGTVAEDVAGTAKSATENALENNPELQRLTRERNALIQRVQDEVIRLVSQAGVDPNTLEGEAQDAMQDARETVNTAAQQARHNPTEVRQIVNDALHNLFQRGQQAAGQVENEVNQVHYEDLIALLAERGNMSRQEAEQKISEWEYEYHHLRQQGEQVLKKATHEAEQFQAEARAKLDESRIEAEERARELAEATTKAIARMALIAFAAIMIGAVAGGIGGIAGATAVTIPVVEVEESDSVQTTPVSTPVDQVTVTNTPSTAP
jgi:ElaB/YqjD/DUF883 family membrane-anchored ribosome-binding protein